MSDCLSIRRIKQNGMYHCYLLKLGFSSPTYMFWTFLSATGNKSWGRAFTDSFQRKSNSEYVLFFPKPVSYQFCKQHFWVCNLSGVWKLGSWSAGPASWPQLITLLLEKTHSSYLKLYSWMMFLLASAVKAGAQSQSLANQKVWSFFPLTFPASLLITVSLYSSLSSPRLLSYTSSTCALWKNLRHVICMCKWLIISRTVLRSFKVCMTLLQY